MYDNGDGYLRFDGKNYITYDDNGIEMGRMSYDKKNNETGDIWDINKIEGKKNKKDKK